MLAAARMNAGPARVRPRRPSHGALRPSGPGTALRKPGFVSVHLIRGALSHVLALALHRDATGALRHGCSSALLAAAFEAGDLACDPVVLPWIPALPEAEAFVRDAWGRKTGHEGAQHRQLRAAAAVLLLALAPGAEVEPEETRHAHGRAVRPDLRVEPGGGRVIVAEVGAVDGDAVEALLRPPRRGRGVRRTTSVTHVVVLPFAGRRANGARGYVIRPVGVPPLAVPTRTELRLAWRALLGNPRRVAIQGAARSDGTLRTTSPAGSRRPEDAGPWS